MIKRHRHLKLDPPLESRQLETEPSIVQLETNHSDEDAFPVRKNNIRFKAFQPKKVIDEIISAADRRLAKLKLECLERRSFMQNQKQSLYATQGSVIMPQQTQLRQAIRRLVPT